MIDCLFIRYSLFPIARSHGPAFGTQESHSWQEFSQRLLQRREGEKDGPCFVPSTFKPEPDGRVRRLKENVESRSMVALDCETNKETGEIPPSSEDAMDRIKARGWGGVVYTSHSHTKDAPRYRVVLPISEEIGPELPAPEVVADVLGLGGVTDRSKIGAESLFYFPSAAPGQSSEHRAEVIDGLPIDAGWLRAKASAVLVAREAERERQRREAMDAAAKRLAERIQSGYDSEASIIDKVRSRLDLTEVLLSHGYEPRAEGRFLYPESESGVAGVYLLQGSDGIERVYSHHAHDPLAPDNLPPWCMVKAVDAVDVVTILDYDGDQKAALRALAKRFDVGESEVEPTPLRIVNPVSLAGKPVPEREWIVPDWLPVGHVTLNYGDGGTGKTLLAQQLMASCATGRPWCGLDVRQCRSLALFCEDDDDELHRRQDAINRAFGIEFADLGNMRWVSGVGADNLMVTFGSDGRARTTPRYAQIAEAAKDFGARLLVLDTAADLFGGNENERAQVRQFIGYVLNSLARDLNAAVLLNAHPSRSGLSMNGDMDGGSTAWSNSARSRWSLARPSSKDSDGSPYDPNMRILTRRKANYASIGDKIDLRWGNGTLHTDSRNDKISNDELKRIIENNFLFMIEKYKKRGSNISASPNSINYAPKIFSKDPDCKCHDAKQLKISMNSLLDLGIIHQEDYGRPGNIHKRLILTNIASLMN